MYITLYNKMARTCEKKDANIVYNANYNISFFGLEKCHSFDSCKYAKIKKVLDDNDIPTMSPSSEATQEQLMLIHRQEYLDKLQTSDTIAEVCEFPLFSWIPNFALQRLLLSPLRWQVSGTILASHIALSNERKWSINLGGGMHHAHANGGGGWCVYNDIGIAINTLIESKAIERAMIVDLDVHQGDGIELDIKNGIIPSKRVWMIDAYNPDIYPNNRQAMKAINNSVYVYPSSTDATYLADVELSLKSSYNKFKPDIVYYNAGTDILEGDPLNGGVKISPNGVIQRDSLVMSYFTKRDVPIVMVLSGGYSKKSVDVISESILKIEKTL
jgi:histone deacetylase 11